MTRQLRKISYLVGLIGLLGMVGCGAVTPISQEAAPQVALAAAETSRETTPALGEDDLATLTADNQAFALDLYRYLAEQDEGNLFLSPHSISAALAMTYAGAQGETEAAMADALHFTLPQAQLHPAFNALDLALSERGEGAEGQDGGGFRLNIVNALWGQQGHAFEDAYLETLARHYGAGLRLVDYIQDAEAARQAINGWVSEQTEGRIEDLIPEGALDELTRLVLTNAIYFNAAWAKPFEKAETQEGDFYLLDGSAAQVPMMHQTASFSTARGDGYQAVELPYDGYELSMVILLPDADTFEAFERDLDQAQLAAILEDLKSERVDLTMPRFEMRSKFSLGDALSELGMGQAFTDAADFSGIDGTQELMITDVFHQTFVSVDEEGTEAAAATGVVMGLTSMPAEPRTMRIDRPFIFLIRDIKTGAVLFLGRTVDPR